MDVARPKLGSIYNKTCFNQLRNSTENQNRLRGISPSERLGSMFQSGLYSDCSFLVEGEEIRAHKLILAAASHKMEQMFLGSDVRRTELVEVPYTFRVMQLILKHVYLQDMDIENIDEAQDVIEAAYFFEMSDLVELCCAGIEPETLDDLWPALNLACLYQSRVLKESCLVLAIQHCEQLIMHPGLLNTSPEALSFLLSREVIKIAGEMEVIQVAILWAQNRMTNESNVRQELENGGILQQLRILALSENDFTNFITNLGKELFNDEELHELEYNYYSDSCLTCVNSSRIERMLECRVPICGTDYLAVSSDNDNFSVDLKVYETGPGLRPTLKMIVLPSQINPANILYDNVSHKTHYNEHILIEMSVNENVVIGRGTFCDRIKYGDDVHIAINTFNIAALYTNLLSYDGNEQRCTFYLAKIKVIFKNHGYYPLAVDTKTDKNALLKLQEPCRLIHEFILSYPKD